MLVVMVFQVVKSGYVCLSFVVALFPQRTKMSLSDNLLIFQNPLAIGPQNSKEGQNDSLGYDCNHIKYQTHRRKSCITTSLI